MRAHHFCLAAYGLLSILAHNTYASWMDISLADQIGFADLIVEGSVIEITEAGFSVGNRTYEAADVNVTNVLKNTTDMTDIVEVRIGQPGSAISGGLAFGASTDIRYTIGQQGTWLLVFDPMKQIFWATHPSQFQVDDISELISSIGPKASGLPVVDRENIEPVAAIAPEPTTLALAVLGLMGMCCCRREKS